MIMSANLISADALRKKEETLRPARLGGPETPCRSGDTRVTDWNHMILDTYAHPAP